MKIFSDISGRARTFVVGLLAMCSAASAVADYGQIDAGDAYIESTGNQYINTGCCVMNPTRIEVDFALTSVTNQECVFGFRHGDYNVAFSVVPTAPEPRFAWLIQNGTNYAWRVMPTAADLKRHTLVLDIASNQVCMDGVCINGLPYVPQDHALMESLFLFWGCETSRVRPAFMRLYSCRIRDNGVLTHDYAPMRLPDGRAGVCDMVTTMCFGSDVGGPMLASDNLPSMPADGVLDKPRSALSFAYDGQEHVSVMPSPFYAITGEAVGKAVGIYVAQVVPAPGVVWADGTSDAVTVTMTILPATPDGDCVEQVGDYTWSYCVSGGVAIIRSPNSDRCAVTPEPEGALTIPSSLGGCPVVAIGDSAFSGCEMLTAVTIPEGVTSIGQGAFGACMGLTGMTIPSSVTSIGDYAFAVCFGLESVTISEGVTSIGESAFEGCVSLMEVTIPSSVTNISYNAFANCEGLESVTILSSATSIGGWAFFNCVGLTEVTISEGATSIGQGAFEGCYRLMGVTIPEGVTSIGDSAFSGCSGLMTVEISSSVTNIGSHAFERCGALTVLTISPGVQHIGDSAFAWCGGLTTVEIPSSVTSIGASAFENCGGLMEVTIPKDVQYIGDYAFAWCGGLNAVTLLSAVPHVGGGVFDCCGGSLSVTIPLSVTNAKEWQGLDCFFPDTEIDSVTIIPDCDAGIGNHAFDQCQCLRTVTIPEGVTSIGEWAFAGCGGLIGVEIPSSVTNIGASAFEGCYGLMGVTISEGVTSIGEGAFWGCSGLTTVEIPSSVTSIGGESFGNCNGLMEVTIPEGVQHIGDYAFSGCNGLTEVTIPSSVASIGDSAFSWCSGLNAVTLLSAVAHVGYGVFEGCGWPMSVTIPLSATNAKEWQGLDCFFPNAEIGSLTILPDCSAGIGNHAFDQCQCLRTVTIPEGVTSIGDSAFSGCGGLMTVEIPSSVTSIGERAFENCGGLSAVTIPEGVTTIGDWAFENCVGLMAVEIPSSVQSIGDYAFSGCNGLAEVTIPSSVASIGDYAFAWCSGLNAVTLLSAVAHVGYGVFEGCGWPMSVTIPLSATNAKEWQGLDCFFPDIEIGSLTIIPDCSAGIGNNAFEQCRGLGVVIIPEGVTSIGSGAFYGCEGLTAVDIPSSVTNIGECAFTYCSRLTEVTIPEGVTHIGYATFGSCMGLTAMTIPSSVTSIGDCAFAGCCGLTEVTIPPNVQYIGEYAFAGCTGLTAMTLLSAAPYVGYEAFEGCGWPLSVTIPLSVTNAKEWQGLDCFFPDTEIGSVTIIPDCDAGIGNHAFDQCQGLRTVTIPEGVTSIGDYAFSGCEGLTAVEIPSSVTNIGEGAFSKCAGLAEVTIPSNVTRIGDGAFGVCSGLTSVEIPSSVTRIGDGAFLLCFGLESVTISEGVTSIGEMAFCGCTNLTEVTIPSSVTNIDYDAFEHCDSLASVTILSSATSIGGWTFASCEALTSVYFMDDAPNVGPGIFGGSPNVTSYVLKGTTGWKAPGSTELPALWPVGDADARPIAWKTDGSSHEVAFRLGEHGTRTGGGELVQTVADGAAAVAPEVGANPADFDAAHGWKVFDGWDADFSNVTGDLVVNAVYRDEFPESLFDDALFGDEERATAGIPWRLDLSGYEGRFVVCDGEPAAAHVLMSASVTGDVIEWTPPAAGRYRVYVDIVSLDGSGEELRIVADLVAAEPDPASLLWNRDAEGCWLIGTEAELESLRRWVLDGNATTGMTFRQTADIALTAPWPGIGVYDAYLSSLAFSGVYRGDGHSVSNLVFKDMTGEADAALDPNNYRGLFNQTQNAIIRDLKVWCAGFEGGISGEFGGAAIVGNAVGTEILSCEAHGAILGATHNVAGIATRVVGPSRLFQCVNRALISGCYTKIGGITAYTMGGEVLFGGCANFAPVSTVGADPKAGRDGVSGIIAYTGGGTTVIRECANYARITSSNPSAKVGQLVGFMSYGIYGQGTQIVRRDGLISGQPFASRGLPAIANKANASTVMLDGQYVDLYVLNEDEMPCAGRSYAVVAPVSSLDFRFSEPGTVSFDDWLWPSFVANVTATSGLAVTSSRSGTVTTFTAASERVEVIGDDREWRIGDLYERVIESPVSLDDAGLAQRVCTGWIAWNVTNVNVIAGGTNSVVRFELQNAGPYGVSEVWATNYWLALSAQAGGRIGGGESGFRAAGETVWLEALPDDGMILARWGGDVDGCVATNFGGTAVLVVAMDRARSIRAEFVADPTLRLVTFDLGEHGTRTGGGELVQRVHEGDDAVPPSVRTESGWVLTGWSGSYRCVTNDVVVAARYRTVYPSLRVSSVTGEASAQAGGTMIVSWRVVNEGNTAFVGGMKERVLLASVDDPGVTNVIAEIGFEGTIPTDGYLARQQEVTIPLRLPAGEWRVCVETGVEPSSRIFGGSRIGASEQTLTVAAAPLPELAVRLLESPDSLMPGDTVTVRYAESNVGTAKAVGPWTDAIYLVSPLDGDFAKGIGTRVRLANLSVAGGLAVGGEATHEVAVALPATIPLAGKVAFLVVPDAADEVAEMQEDDATQEQSFVAEQRVTLGKRLYLEASAASVRENATSGVRLTIRRSGPTTEPLVVAVGASADGQVSMPATVTIPAGSVSTIFIARPIDNAAVDGPREVSLSARADGFAAGGCRLVILDDEVPSLHVTVSSASLREGGEALVATVTRDLATDEPLTVYIGGVSGSQCACPSSVVIPAGETSVTFEIAAANDETAEIGADMTLRVSAAGHNSGSVKFTVEDDDVPGVTLTLFPEEVSEGAGTHAAYATLSRVSTNGIAKPITVRLTASESDQLILPSSITIPAYTMAARFAIGTVDNGLDDGDREVEIAGAVVIESCGCSGQPSSGDRIQASVLVIDNDGPTLSLRAEPSTMKEGADLAGHLVLSHNSVLDEDLTVRLSCDRDGEIVLPRTVTIPAGATSVRVPVRTLDDGVTDGGQLVSVYADDDSGTFAPGSTWVQVSDQNLPDLRVATVVPETLAAVAKDEVRVAFEVVNDGFADCGARVPFTVHVVKNPSSLTMSDTAVLHGQTAAGLAVGGSETVEVRLPMPEMPADYRIAVALDEDGTIGELDKANNTGWSAPLAVGALYTAVAEVPDAAYRPGEPVEIGGSATMANGSPAAKVMVDVYVIANGFRRVYPVETGNDGRFALTFAPENGETGHYQVGACYPGLGLTAAQDEFDIYGMKCTSSSPIWNDMVVGDESVKTIYVRNTCGADLTGIESGTSGASGNCAVFCDVPDVIPAYGTVAVRVSMRSLAPTSGDDYEKLHLLLVSSEGASVDVPLYFYGVNPRASLQATPTSLRTSMTVGETTRFSFALRNVGGAASGTISVVPPDCAWLRVIGGGTMELAPNEEGMVTLVLTPDDSLVLNYPYSGRIAVRCENGSDLSIPFTFVPVTETTGRLAVDVTDAITLTDPAAPHVKGADVTVRDVSGKIVAQGRTGDDGVFTSGELPGGRYKVTVSATNHKSKTVEISVIPGQVNSSLVYTEYDAVSYEWKVVPTEIEDEYTIELVMDYDANVPYPVMELTVPDEIPALSEGEEYVAEVVVCNKGLVVLRDVRLGLSGSIGDYTFEQLSPNVETLAAGEAKSIYVRFANPAKKAPLRLRAAKATADPPAAELPPAGLAEVMPCTFGILATAQALCGDEGIELVRKSKNIRLLGTICDIFALVAQGLGELFPSGSGSGGGQGDPRRPRPGEDPVEPVPPNPVVSVQTADCACLISVLDKFLGATIFRGFPSESLVDFCDQLDDVSRSTSLRQLYANLRKVELPDFSEVSDGLDWTKMVSDTFDVYENCRASMGSNRWMEVGLSAKKIYERLKKIAEAAEDTLDLFETALSSENTLLFFDYVDDYLCSEDPSREMSYDDFLRYAGDRATQLTRQDYDGLFDEWHNLIANLKGGGAAKPKKALAARGVSALAADDGDMLAAFNRALASYAELRAMMEEEGFASVNEMLADMALELEEDLGQTDGAQLCATVTLRLSQTMAMTREAFEGTLTVRNGQMGELKDFRLDLRVTDADGNVCNDLFGITPRSLEGFSGTSILAGDASLGVGKSGVGKVLFVPTVNAAPSEEKLYYFGGSFSYRDDVTGGEVVTKLAPVPLMVHPSPFLKLDYFVQRDVYADDPFTPDVVEASMPAELAVLVRNEGAGAAKNVRIDSAQPEVVVNDMGLLARFALADYSLEAAALNGATAYLGLDTVSLGTIGGGESRVAQWWLTSTTEGHFSGVSATVTHLDSWGNPDTSLVDGNVGVHKLIRSLSVEGESLPWFLTSEESDLYGAPDTVFAPDGEAMPVRGDAEFSVSGEPIGVEPTVVVTLSAAGDGWQYVCAELPGAARYTVKSVVRDDGVAIPARNAWITDRRFRDGIRPLLVEQLHLADRLDGAGTRIYEITLSAKRTDVPEVVGFEDCDGGIEHQVRDAVTVAFSSAIDPSTFTADDLALVRQGEFADDLSALVIEPADGSGTRFRIGNLAALCGSFGHYELTVQCAGIADLSGQFGVAGRKAVWTYAGSDVPYIVAAEDAPAKPVRALDALVLVASIPLDAQSVESARIRLNGSDVAQALSIRPDGDSGTRFAVSGLDALQKEDGDYSLILVGADLRSVDGVAGVKDFSVSWTRDTTAPELRDVVRRDDVAGARFAIELSEAIVPESLSALKVRLSRDGQPVALPASLAIAPQGAASYAVTGFGGVLDADGAYELAVSVDGAMDEAGNVAAGEKSVSWSVDTTPPEQPMDLAVSSEYGSLDDVVRVAEDALTISGKVAERGVRVEVLNRSFKGDAVLAAVEPSDSGAFAVAVPMPEGGGSLTLVVRLTDASGNASEREIRVYCDRLALTAALSGAPALDEVAAVVTLAFSEEVVAEDVTLDLFALTRDGEPVSLDGVSLSAVDGATFALSGLEGVCDEDGDYALGFAAESVRKRSSGALSAACAPLTWRYRRPDREPPAIAAVRIDGEELREVYTNGFSVVGVSFSEPVNASSLMAEGLMRHALRLERLDADGSVVDVVPADSGVVWNDAGDGVTWTLAERAVGPVRVAVDAALVADAAGNGLSAEGRERTVGLRGFAPADGVLAQVDSYAMPSWHAGELYVGEKTAAGAGKIRHYAEDGSWTYLKADGADIEVPASGCQGASVALADTDGDGVAETYVGTADGRVLGYPGARAIATGDGRAVVSAADVDGDGRDELAVGFLSGAMRILSRESASGEFASVVLTDGAGRALKVPNGRATPVLADVNHDGRIDVLTGDTAGNAWVYLGEGEAWCATPILVFASSGDLADRSRLGYGDVDGDGVEDILVGRSDGTVTVLRGVETPSPCTGVLRTPFTISYRETKGAANPNPAVYEPGASFAFLPLADDESWAFAGWDVPAVTASMAGELTVTALWRRQQCRVFESGWHQDGDVVWQGVRTNVIDKGVECRLEVSSPITCGTTQYVCTGYSVWLGDNQISGGGTSLTVTPRSDLAVEWLWTTNYWFSASAGPHGSVVCAPAGWRAADSVETMEIRPDADCRFAGLEGDVDGCSLSNGVVTVPMDRARDLRALFDERASVIDDSGEWYVGDVYTNAVASPVAEGGTQLVCRGWAAWNGSPTNVVARGDDTRIRFELANAEAYGIVVAWQTNYWLEVVPPEHGAIVGATNGWHAAGGEVALAAEPAEGYGFGRWTGDLDGCVQTNAGTLGRCLVAMDRARRIGAEFERNVFAVTFDVGAHGARVGGGELRQDVPYGEAAVAPELAVDEGWRFDGWDVGLGDVRADRLVRAVYSAVEYAIAYAGTMDAPNEGNPRAYTVLDEVTFLPLADTRAWRFVGWTPASIARGTTGDVEVTANWERRLGAVTVDGVAGTNAVFVGDLFEAELPSPVAEGGTQLVCRGWAAWSGSPTNVVARGEGAAISFEVRDEAFYRVSVAWRTNYWLEVVPPEHGAIVGATNGWHAAGGEVALAAKPDAHYHLREWTGTDAASAQAETLTLVMDGAKTVGAVMEIDAIGIGEAANAAELEWFTSGASDWFGEWNESAADAVHDVRSGAIGDSAETVLGVRFSGKGTFSFDWRASCQAQYDAVRLTVDGRMVNQLSGETGWRSVTVDLGLGDHEVSWAYRKGRSGSEGEDAVWVDNVRWVASGAPTLAEALNYRCDLEWTTGGAAGWETFDSESSYEGGSCAVSGPIGDMEESWVRTSVEGPGRLEFAWAVSCEDWYDWFDFLVDGETVEMLTGETGWLTVKVDLGEGSHDLCWRYWKDEMDDEAATGSDCAMLDYVRWTPAEDVDEPQFGKVDVSEFYAWLRQYRLVDEDASSLTPAQLKRIAGERLQATSVKGETLLSEFVAGTDPTDAEDRFVATITMNGSIPVVTWTPDLNEGADVPRRTYRLLGAKTLGAEWTDVTDLPDEGRKEYRFFQVEVDMP